MYIIIYTICTGNLKINLFHYIGQLQLYVVTIIFFGSQNEYLLFSRFCFFVIKVKENAKVYVQSLINDVKSKCKGNIYLYTNIVLKAISFKVYYFVSCV